MDYNFDFASPREQLDPLDASIDADEAGPGGSGTGNIGGGLLRRTPPPRAFEYVRGADETRGGRHRNLLGARAVNYDMSGENLLTYDEVVRRSSPTVVGNGSTGTLARSPLSNNNNSSSNVLLRRGTGTGGTTSHPDSAPPVAVNVGGQATQESPRRVRSDEEDAGDGSVPSDSPREPLEGVTRVEPLERIAARRVPSTGTTATPGTTTGPFQS